MEFSAEFLVIYPFFAIMFGQRGQVSAAGIGTLLAVWYIVQVLAEVPTGIIADRVSKKWVLVCAKSLRVLVFAAWLVWPSFWGYFVGFVLWGIAWALSSGAFEAYLYESLPAKSKHHFGNLYGKVNAIDMAAYVIAFGLSFIIGTNYNLLLTCSIAACAVSVLVALSLPGSKRVVKRSNQPRILSAAVKHIMTTPRLQELLIGALIIGSLGEALQSFRQLYYTQAGLPDRFSPLLLGAENLLAAVLFWNLVKFDSFLGKRRILIITAATGVFALSFLGNPAEQILGLLCLTRVVKLLQIHYQSGMQHLSQDNTRATIASIYSFGSKLGASGLLALIGLVATGSIIIGSLRIVTLSIMSIFIAAQGVLILWQRKRILNIAGLAHDDEQAAPED